MSYIDQVKYKDLLNKLAKGTKKQQLKENYVDLRPINSLAEYSSPMIMSTNDAKYPGSMEEDIETEGNAFTKALAKTPKGGELKVGGKVVGKDRTNYDDPSVKDEGLHGDGPMLTGPTGYKLENLSLEERNQLKEYIQAVKTTKKAIDELLEKAKTPTMEDDNTGKSLAVGQPPME